MTFLKLFLVTTIGITLISCSDASDSSNLDSMLDELSDQSANKAHVAEMQKAFDAVRSRPLAPDLKLKAWNKFLTTYSEDLPGTLDDNVLNQQASDQRLVELARQISVLHEAGFLSDVREAGHQLNDASDSIKSDMRERLSTNDFDDLILGLATVSEANGDLTSAWTYAAMLSDDNSERAESLLSTLEQKSLGILYEEIVNLARSSYIKDLTEEALGLEQTAPETSNQWKRLFAENNPAAETLVLTNLNETSSASNAIAITGDNQEITVKLINETGAVEKSKTVMRDDQI